MQLGEIEGDLKGQIECHRLEWVDNDNLVLPVLLMKEAFARFDANCKMIKLAASDVSFARELFDELSTPLSNEAQLLSQKARQLLSRYLFRDLPDCSIQGLQLANSVSDGSYLCKQKLVFNLE
jgi:hypothetical protein